VDEWRIIFLRPARRYLAQLPQPEQRRILDALGILRGGPNGVWESAGAGSSYARTGKRGRWAFVVTRIGPRGDAYK
jgi:hypothetical protein